MPQTYTQGQVMDKLFTSQLTVTKLHTEGYLPFRWRKKRMLYDAPYIDRLANHLRRVNGSDSLDQTAAKLYFLAQQYRDIPDGCSQGQKDKHHARFKRLCDALVANGEAAMAETLSDAIGVPVQRIRNWAHKGKIVAVILGYSCYLSSGQYSFLVKLFTTRLYTL